MKCIYLLFSLLVIAAVKAEEEDDELPLATFCTEQECQPPNCRCSSTIIPGGLIPRNTPQFVLTTFAGGVNDLNMEIYRDLLYGRANSNGCPISTTLFVNHQYTDYHHVNELYNEGHEIGLHSISRQTPQTFWAQASYEQLVNEIADQRMQMAHFANIPIAEIKGVRMPFMQLAGNNSFLVMSNHDLTYDSSWSTVNFREVGIWPYTLDYASIQDCLIPPCPTASIPGVWVSPVISWLDLQGFPCSSVEACIFGPDRENEEAWFQFLVTNFERHYLGNRAPFAFNSDTAYIREFPAMRRAYIRFMNLINNLSDVFMVNAAELIDWVKDPIPVNEYIQKPCRTFASSPCWQWQCLLEAQHNQQTYWMRVCTQCPRFYPWVGNPLGL